MRCCFHSFKDLLGFLPPRCFEPVAGFSQTDCKGKSLYETTKNFSAIFCCKLFTTRLINFWYSSVIFRADGKDTIRIVMNKFFRDFRNLFMSTACKELYRFLLTKCITIFIFCEHPGFSFFTILLFREPCFSNRVAKIRACSLLPNLFWKFYFHFPWNIAPAPVIAE
jgi:hypothetical protein